MRGRLSLNYQKKHVYVLVSLIEDTSNWEYMDELITIKYFPFMYNGVNNANPLFGYDIDKFVSGLTVPM